MESNQLLRLALDNEFWQGNSSKILPTMFPDEVRPLFDTIVEGHKKYERNLTIDEVRHLFRISNPTLTRAQRNNAEEILLDIETMDPIGSDVAKDVLSHAWRIETYREIADTALKGMDGKLSDLNPFQRIIESRGDDFIPVDDTTTIVNNDFDSILESLSDQFRWRFNIRALDDKVPGIAPGEFTILFARPNVGKTLSYVSFSAAPGGWCWQGANVAVFANEEAGKRTTMRAIQAASQMSREQVHNPEFKAEARAIWNNIRPNFQVIDSVDGTIARIDNYCRRNRPDILVIDQLDKVSVPGSFNGTHEKLKQVYAEAREIAKRYEIAVVGICQASAEAEGKTRIHFSQMDGSKTGKAGEGDLIIGIGAQSIADGQEDSPDRWLTVSKNKVNGFHGTVMCKIDAKTSTFKD